MRALDGNAGHRGRVLPHPSVPVESETVVEPPIEPFDESQAPNDLNLEERHVWLELAPIAVSRGMVMADVKALPFRMLCQHVALAKRYAASVTEAGSANHRGMIQAIDRELLRFRIVDAGGKALAAPKVKEAVDPLEDKYFGSRHA